MSSTRFPVLQADRAPHPDPVLEAKYWSVYAYRHFVDRNHLLGVKRRVEASLLEQSRVHGEGELGDIPRVPADTISVEEFQSVYVEGNIPVVLEGFARDWPAVRKWSPEYFKEQFGHQSVRARADSRSVTDFTLEDTSLADLIDDICAGGKMSANGWEDFFNNNPQLREDLGIANMGDYLVHKKNRKGIKGRILGRILSTQMFMQNQTCCTGWHCASGVNLFANIYGRKRWLMAAPRHMIWMYPVIHRDLHVHLSHVDHRKTHAELAAEGYELYQYVPKYTTVLEPGDVIYVPLWWWHAVDNESVAIGVAHRGVNDMFGGHPLASILGMLSTTSAKMMLSILTTGWGTDKPMEKYGQDATP